MTRSMTRIAELEKCEECCSGSESEDECETCCLTECACLVCKCCETKRSHYKEVCGDCGKCNGIDKGSNDFNTKCCDCWTCEGDEDVLYQSYKCNGCNYTTSDPDPDCVKCKKTFCMMAQI